MNEEEPTYATVLRLRLWFITVVGMTTRTGKTTALNFAISVGRAAISVTLHYLGDE